MILCKSKNRVIVEYTLRDMRKPIGVAEYQLTQQLPEYLQQSLPAIEELEATLAKPTKDSDETKGADANTK
jgi:CRISPR/Cas system-associated exonuclease Cas4 (RecB family)